MKKHKFGFLLQDKSVISEKVKEAFSSVLPISVIVLILCFTITPMESSMLLAFLVGMLFVVVGMGLFSLGVDVAMTPIGEHVGKSIIGSKKMWIIVPAFFLLGVIITVAEPDLHTFANQLINVIDFWTLIITVGVGVGFFLVVALLRMVLKIKLSYILIGSYAVVFILSFFVPSGFIPSAFDSGGVTTGPMSVPFILALGTGLVGIRNDKNANSDGFGLTALCSIGPIIAVMVLGIVYNPSSVVIPESSVEITNNSRDLVVYFANSIPKCLVDVGIALLPMVIFFYLSQLFGYRVEKSKQKRILVGILYTYFGLVFFLVGVTCGFEPIGKFLGRAIGNSGMSYIAIPIGILMGFFVVAAEPAVHVLSKQVYTITQGAIPKKALMISLMIGVGISVGLSMVKILLQIPIMYFLAPCYLIAVILTFFVPNIFTAIAFDSGGVASGTMTAGLLLPFALGLCSATGGEVFSVGFGVVAFVAMTPLITIQLLGLFYKFKLKKLKKVEEKSATYTAEVIEAEDVIE